MEQTAIISALPVDITAVNIMIIVKYPPSLPKKKKKKIIKYQKSIK